MANRPPRVDQDQTGPFGALRGLLTGGPAMTLEEVAEAEYAPRILPQPGAVILFKSLNRSREFNRQAEYPAIVTQVTPDGPIVTCFPPHRAPFPIGQPLPHVDAAPVNAVEAWDWLPKA